MSAAMDASAWIALLRRRWWLILLCVAAAVGAAAAITASTDEEFESSTRLFVNLPAADGVQEALQGVQLSLNLLESYAEIATSSSALARVADELGGDASPSAIRGQLSAEVERNTLLITITARSTDPELAQRLAAAAGDVFTDTVRDLESGRTGGVRASVIDEARRPGDPVSPRRNLNLAAGLLLGLLAGLAAALGLEALDKTVRHASETAGLTGAPLLATVPRHRSRTGGAVGPAVAEAFRSLWTSIHFASRDRPVRILVVTSAEPGDGKTTTALGLARAASAGQRVVLVEGDLRRPQLSPQLGLDPAPGVTAVLAGTASLETALQRVDGNLQVLVAGEPTPNPAGIAASQALATLLDDLAGRVDLVVVDSPPLLAVADGSALAALADTTILVVSAGRTPRTAAAEAARRIAAVGGNLLGVVFNRAPQTTDYPTAAYLKDTRGTSDRS